MRMQLHLAGMPTPRSTDGLRATQPVATEKLVQILTQNFSPNVEVVDIGCGDGTFTLEIAERFQPAAICGIDPAADAIAVARSRIPRDLRGSVSFEVGDIYNLQAVARAGDSSSQGSVTSPGQTSSCYCRARKTLFLCHSFGAKRLQPSYENYRKSVQIPQGA